MSIFNIFKIREESIWYISGAKVAKVENIIVTLIIVLYKPICACERIAGISQSVFKMPNPIPK